jgi:hypothetical protein
VKDQVNLNDVRRMKLLIAAGASADEISLRLRIVPALVKRWFGELTKQAADLPAVEREKLADPAIPEKQPTAAPGDASQEKAGLEKQRRRGKG